MLMEVAERIGPVEWAGGLIPRETRGTNLTRVIQPEVEKGNVDDLPMDTYEGPVQENEAPDNNASYRSLAASLFEMSKKSSGSGQAQSPQNAFLGLREGSQGESVKALQKALVRWMPGWKDRLSIDGIYGPQTHRALEFFKKSYGLGKDGSSMDGRTAEALRKVQTGDFWKADSSGEPPYRLRRERIGAYEKARKHGWPLDEPGAARPLPGLSPAEVQETAKEDPHKIIIYKGYEMEALTAKRYIELEKLVAKNFPDKHAEITSTMDGKHSDPNHGTGLAIDFILVNSGEAKAYVSPEESYLLESLAEQCGFNTFNEYVYSSTYNTGTHMHISRIDYNSLKMSRR